MTRTGLPRQPALALVLWSGDLGGAEILTANLARALRRLGADATVTFIETPWPLASRWADANIPFHSLGWGRGRDVLRHPRRYASEIAKVGADGALLVDRGLMAAALRAGGYRGSIVSVEHGALLLDLNRRSVQALSRQAARVVGARVADAQIAVSDFMLEVVRHHAHARRVARIYNGIDPDTHVPGTGSRANPSSELVVGLAGRLIPGKGADQLISAVGQARAHTPIRLLIAGDGPERSRLAAHAQRLGIASKVELLGMVEDMPAFWRRCDVAATPPDTFVESFSIATLEAMSCGRPVVATRIGAVPELVLDGITGALVRPGDVDGLANALVQYARQPGLREKHGLAGRERAITRFHIDDCARAYLELFDELAVERAARTRSRPPAP